MASASNNVLIAVSTFRRPAQAARLLDTLAPQIGDTGVQLVIIDNDGDAPIGHPRPQYRWADYVVEGAPGIVATRNRALAIGDAIDAHAIVFIDDDEWPAHDWLDALTRRANSSSAGVLTGPVITEMDDSAPRWVTRFGFYQRKLYADKARLSTAATNNTYLRMEAWRAAGSPLFDHSFSETGGSDTDFFNRLHERGVEIEYVRAAVMHEDVSADRMSFRWVTQRNVRNGIVLGRLSVRSRGRLLTAIAGLSRIAKGLLFGLVALLISHERLAGAYGTLTRGFGYILALTRFRIREYARESLTQ